MNEPTNTLETLRDKKNHVAHLSSFQIPALSRFHFNDTPFMNLNPVDIHGFKHLLNDPELSIVGSAFCVRSLHTNPAFVRMPTVNYSNLITLLEQKHSDGQFKTSGLLHGNPYTISHILPVLKLIGAKRDSDLVESCIEIAKAALRKPGVCVPNFPPNGYLTYWALIGLESWGMNVGEIQSIAGASIDWSLLELFKQISLFISSDEESDASQLAFNLLVQKRFGKSELREPIIELSLKTLFDAQLTRGVWEKKNPLFVYGGRGDAYCFTFEILSALLSEFMDDIQVLEPHDKNLARALTWIERSVQIDGTERLWRTGYRIDTDKPESWATAEVYSFLHLYHRYLTLRIQEVLHKTFRARPKPAKPNAKAFDDLKQPNIKLKGSEPKRLDDMLKEKLLDPLKEMSGTVDTGGLSYSLARHPSRKHRIRSGIFFGPPGTGKTTYVGSIAEYLGWPLVTLDPSDFAREGLPLIPSVTSRIFEQLLELEDTVIFFDEMEEMMRERDGKGEEGSVFEQRFLTTSLLPQLQDLHDKATCIFIVATNSFSSIDAAARRAGRFDFHIQILPPAHDAKLKIVKGEIQDQELHDAFIQELIEDPGEPESQRNKNRKKFEWATRTEVLNLISDLKVRGPNSARDILDNFEPVLYQDDQLKKLEAEQKYNSF
jgi:hypothetical protein